MSTSSDRLFASVAATQSIVLAGLVVLVVVGHQALHLGAGYSLKAIGGFVVVTGVILARAREYHRFDRFGPANQITAVRAELVALVASLIGEPATAHVAAGVVAVSLLVTILDGVDGQLARRTRMASAFGARFDMETDSALILALAILAWQYDKAGPWVVLSGLLRYLFVASGWLWPWMKRPLRPTVRGKAICVIQIVALILAVAPVVERPASTVIAACGLLALSYSFVVDTMWLRRHAAA